MSTGAEHLRPFSGRVWRIRAAGADPLSRVTGPEGRFHHGGQPALYASLSAEGAGIALASYLRPGDGPRLIWPLRLETEGMADLRDDATCAALGVAPGDLVARWSEDRAEGLRAASWRASDRMRALGATGLLYPSRKAPEHGHLVLFDAAGLRRDGPPAPWPAPPVDR